MENDEEGTFTEEQMRQAIEAVRKLPSCPLCSGHGIKAWHPEGMCPFGGKVH